MLYYNKKLRAYSQRLRKNMTDAEQRLWSYIRCRQLKSRLFYRQRIIGSYIVDFYCPAANLIIEIDGGQHYSMAGIRKDEKRDAYFKDLNLMVLRFSDHEVFINIKGVVEKIEEYL